MGPLIAIVGSDGSGKSTLGDALIAWLNERRPAALCHLGKQSGNLGRRVAGWPIVGRGAGRAIEGRVKRLDDPRGPGLLATLVQFGFVLRRRRRFAAMQRLRAQGVTVIADRLPQVEVPFAFDGPIFARAGTDGLRGRLAAIERRQLAAMTAERPSLVLRLLVDLETAIARKPDHRPDALARKIADLPRLTFGGAPIVDIDANRSFDAVLADAKAAIAAVL